MYLKLYISLLTWCFSYHWPFGGSLGKIEMESHLTCGLSLQDGIEPMWEDEKNKRGGRWLITLNKQQRRSDLDRFWLETVSTVALPVAAEESCVCVKKYLTGLILVCYTRLLTYWQQSVL